MRKDKKEFAKTQNNYESNIKDEYEKKHLRSQ